ncbi:11315_t:CDS:2, partial [Racocetra persica]
LANQNNMIRLDTLSLTWTIFSTETMAPIGVESYSAILLNNSSILYIGGQSDSINGFLYASLDKSTSGDIPSPRSDHGAVYTQILILYGYPDSSIMALDILKFEWSRPTISSGDPNIILRRFTSILIGAYVFIAFGASGSGWGMNSTNKVFLLDVSQKDNYKWVASYDPAKPFQPVQSSMTSASINIGAIIGGTFGGIAMLIILSTAAVLIIKKYGRTSHSFIITQTTFLYTSQRD